MLEMLRKKLIDAGIDTAVGSMDYWGTQLEGVLLDMYDLGAAAEREACAALCTEMGNKQTNQCFYDPWDCASSIRARGHNENAPLP